MWLSLSKKQYMLILLQSSCHLRFLSPRFEQTVAGYKNKYAVHATGTQFFGIVFNTTLSWKNHTHTLTGELSKACDVITAVKKCITQEPLKMGYFSYFHTIMS
jgi:hypothetical protein